MGNLLTTEMGYFHIIVQLFASILEIFQNYDLKKNYDLNDLKRSTIRSYCINKPHILYFNFIFSILRIVSQYSFFCKSMYFMSAKILF